MDDPARLQSVDVAGAPAPLLPQLAKLDTDSEGTEEVDDASEEESQVTLLTHPSRLTGETLSTMQTVTADASEESDDELESKFKQTNRIYQVPVLVATILPRSPQDSFRLAFMWICLMVGLSGTISLWQLHGHAVRAREVVEVPAAAFAVEVAATAFDAAAFGFVAEMLSGVRNWGSLTSLYGLFNQSGPLELLSTADDPFEVGSATRENGTFRNEANPVVGADGEGVAAVVRSASFWRKIHAIDTLHAEPVLGEDITSRLRDAAARATEAFDLSTRVSETAQRSRWDPATYSASNVSDTSAFTSLLSLSAEMSFALDSMGPFPLARMNSTLLAAVSNATRLESLLSDCFADLVGVVVALSVTTTQSNWVRRVVTANEVHETLRSTSSTADVASAQTATEVLLHLNSSVASLPSINEALDLAVVVASSAVDRGMAISLRDAVRRLQTTATALWGAASAGAVFEIIPDAVREIGTARSVTASGPLVQWFSSRQSRAIAFPFRVNPLFLLHRESFLPDDVSSFVAAFDDHSTPALDRHSRLRSLLDTSGNEPLASALRGIRLMLSQAADAANTTRADDTDIHSASTALISTAVVCSVVAIVGAWVCQLGVGTRIVRSHLSSSWFATVYSACVLLAVGAILWSTLLTLEETGSAPALQRISAGYWDALHARSGTAQLERIRSAFRSSLPWSGQQSADDAFGALVAVPSRAAWRFAAADYGAAASATAVLSSATAFRAATDPTCAAALALAASGLALSVVAGGGNSLPTDARDVAGGALVRAMQTSMCASADPSWKPGGPGALALSTAIIDMRRLRDQRLRFQDILGVDAQAAASHLSAAVAETAWDQEFLTWQVARNISTSVSMPRRRVVWGSGAVAVLLHVIGSFLFRVTFGPCSV